jgi:hypothetical protein
MEENFARRHRSHDANVEALISLPIRLINDRLIVQPNPFKEITRPATGDSCGTRCLFRASPSNRFLRTLRRRRPRWRSHHRRVGPLSIYRHSRRVAPSDPALRTVENDVRLGKHILGIANRVMLFRKPNLRLPKLQAIPVAIGGRPDLYGGFHSKNCLPSGERVANGKNFHPKLSIHPRSFYAPIGVHFPKNASHSR